MGCGSSIPASQSSTSPVSIHPCRIPITVVPCGPVAIDEVYAIEGGLQDSQKMVIDETRVEDIEGTCQWIASWTRVVVRRFNEDDVDFPTVPGDRIVDSLAKAFNTSNQTVQMVAHDGMELSEQATWVGEGIPNGAIIHCLMTPRPESSLCEQIETTSLPSTLPQLGSRPGLEERKEAQQRNILCKQTSSLQHVFVEASNADWVLELKRAEQERADARADARGLTKAEATKILKQNVKSRHHIPSSENTFAGSSHTNGDLWSQEVKRAELDRAKARSCVGLTKEQASQVREENRKMSLRKAVAFDIEFAPANDNTEIISA